jgi:hypothetical protein
MTNTPECECCGGSGQLDVGTLHGYERCAVCGGSGRQKWIYSPTQWAVVLLAQQFPGLVDGVTDVNGADLTEFLTRLLGSRLKPALKSGVRVITEGGVTCADDRGGEDLEIPPPRYLEEE